MRKLFYIVGLLMTSQIRHDNNEKNVKSIILLCIALLQYKTVSSSFLSSLSCSIFTFRLTLTKKVQSATLVQKGRTSTKFNQVRSASMKTNKNLTNQTPTTRMVIKTKGEFTQYPFFVRFCPFFYVFASS